MRNLVKAIALALALVAMTGNAMAVLVKIEYVGEVSGVTLFDGATNFTGLSAGDSVTGWFLLDTSSPDADASASRGFYPNSLQGAAFNGYVAAPQSLGYSTFLLDVASDAVAFDQREVLSAGEDGFFLTLSGPNALPVVVSDQLDLSIFDLGRWNPSNAHFRFLRADFSQGFDYVPRTLVSGRLTALQVTEVPEPPALSLVALAAMICLLLRLRLSMRNKP